jgi:hypothetical protein
MTADVRVRTAGLFCALIGILTAGVFLSGGSAADQLPERMTITPPKLLSFQINNGEAVTPSYTVKLNNRVEGDVTQYRASLKPDFSDAEGAWKPYSAAPGFAIPSGFTRVDIYFQVRYFKRATNVKQVEYLSNRVADSIEIRLAPKDYTVPAGTARAYAMTHGWTFQCTVGNQVTERCYQEVPFGGDLILQTLGYPRDMFGSKADFVLFGGRELNAGWTFKSLYFLKVNCSANNKNHTVGQWPTPGSRLITIRIHMWTNSGDTCELLLGDMVLTGPGGKTWEDAFK